MLRTLAVNFLLCAVAISLAACKYVPRLDQVLPDKRSEYKKSTTLPDLEVPPDLSTARIDDRLPVPDEGTATFSTYQERVAARKKQRELEGQGENAIEALSGEKVIVVGGEVSAVWQQLHTFWSERGYNLSLDDADYGVQETEWREMDSLRDRFKVFAEPGEQPNTTTLYVSQEGEELRAGAEGEQLDWQSRGRDETILTALVTELKTYLTGSSGAVAATATDISGATVSAATPASGSAVAAPLPQRAELTNTGDGKSLIALNQQFGEAWSRVGAALPRVGAQIEEEDTARGIYKVTYKPSDEIKKKGVLSKLKFWGDGSQDLQVSVTGVGDKSEIVVLNDDGKWDSSAVSKDLLSNLQIELNK